MVDRGLLIHKVGLFTNSPLMKNYFGCSAQVLESVRQEASDFNIYPSQTAQPLYDALVSVYEDQLTADQVYRGQQWK